MQPTFASEKLESSPAIVVGIYDKGSLSTQAKAVDKATKGAVAKAIKAAGFDGKRGATLTLHALAGWDTVILLGMGKAGDLKANDIVNLGGKAVKALNAAKAKKGAIALTPEKSKVKADEFAAYIASGAKLAAYRFDKYKTKEKASDKPSLKSVEVMTGSAAKAKAAYEPMDKVADGVMLTRDLVSEPANIIYPKSLAAQCKELTKLGVKVEVLDQKEMKKLGMGALLGVAQGSAQEPQLVVMQWSGAAKSKKPVAFIGKGVTFDTGGISIKPSKGMEEMKWDMGGSATVIGLMKALAGRKAKVNAIGVVGLVENMPSGTAQRPGDIVTSMSGQTIEVLNTDAEGRLVLADALWYTQERFKPQFMIDLATLTGAIIVSLGSFHAGLFSNNDKLSRQISDAGKEVDERVWRLPMGDDYDSLIDCDVADMQNIGNGEAGSITAAQFLERFVNKLPWAHLDIAGTAWSKKDKDITPKGGTGYGVRLLDRLVADNYEG